nr:MAG TPA: hypothetical protein [Caudoviricetes sp.]
MKNSFIWVHTSYHFCAVHIKIDSYISREEYCTFTINCSCTITGFALYFVLSFSFSPFVFFLLIFGYIYVYLSAGFFLLVYFLYLGT